MAARESSVRPRQGGVLLQPIQASRLLRHIDSITAGPSREELFDALRLVSEGRKVTFRVSLESDSGAVSKKGEIRVQVVGIDAIKGGRHGWSIKLQFGNGDLAVARYSARHRTGVFEDKFNWGHVS